jgi:hypothetical protein
LVRRRRGSALLITMFFTIAVGAVALSAIYLNGSTNLLTKSYEKEDQLRYAAEAALALGKARLNYDPAALPDTGYSQFLSNKVFSTADSQQIAGVFVNLYAGPTGSTTGQFGRFASVVAEVHDAQGNGMVRRLELAQESFAKFAYWTDSESNSGSTIYFGGNDQLWGPVWSNDTISILSTGATFHDEVGSAAPLISGVGNGTFKKGYKVKQKPIVLPSTASLTSKLSGYAAAGNFSFTPPASGNETTVRMRIEFIAIDLNSDGDSTDVDEGFFRVYNDSGSGSVSNKQRWNRADWPSSPTAANVINCGDWHTVGGVSKFFPAVIHNKNWFETLMSTAVVSGGAGMTTTAANNERNATLNTIMNHSGARCYLGGDPHLVAVERNATDYPTASDRQKGGEDTTFTKSDSLGAWMKFTETPASIIQTKREKHGDAKYLFPIYRGFNTNAKGVIYANGTVGVSGVLRGRVTLYSPYTIVILDDLRYASDPGSTDPTKPQCQDILGILSGVNTVVADNAINTPHDLGGSSEVNLDDTKDLYIHSIVMSLGTSFKVQNHDAGPDNANDCQGTNNGRGCLFLTGGVIQEKRGAVGTSGGTGFTKRYSYDRCAVMQPPPYFPTTGRYQDNRYYEIDRIGFNVATLFTTLTPTP